MLCLQFNERCCLAEYESPSDFLIDHSGKLLLRDDENDDLEIGEFEAVVVDVAGAVNENESVFDVFDTRQSTYDYFADLYDQDSGDFSKKVVKTLFENDHPWNPNLLILDRLIVYPEYRGRGYGLLAMRTLIRRLRIGVGLIAIKPFPLQFESSFKNGDSDKGKTLGLYDFKLNQQKSTLRLKKHYGQLGFVPIRGTKFMVSDPEQELPSIDELYPTKNLETGE